MVIYAAYHATIDKLQTIIKENDWECDTIDGRGWSRKDILERFEEDKEVTNYCIVAHPGSVHGLTLTAGHCLCYYSNSFNADHRVQSLERRDRPGMDTTRGTRVVDICNLHTDRMILDNLNEKKHLETLTIEEIKRCLQKQS